MLAKYRIVFTGSLLSGFDIHQVSNQTQHLLKLSEQEMATFFSGKRIPLKKNISFEDANKLKQKLQTIGLQIAIEEESIVSELSIQGDNSSPNSQGAQAGYKSPSIHGLKLEESQQKPTTAGINMDDAFYGGKTTQSNHHTYRDNNAYTTPNSNYYERQSRNEIVEPPSLFSFSVNGRYGRLNYLNASIIFVLSCIPATIIIFMFAVVSPILTAVLLAIAGILSMFFYIKIMILRLHDCNQTGWWALFSILIGIVLQLLHPLLYIAFWVIFSLYLWFMPGSQEANEYGAPPRQGSYAGLIFIIIILVLQIAMYNSNPMQSEELFELYKENTIDKMR